MDAGLLTGTKAAKAKDPTSAPNVIWRGEAEPPSAVNVGNLFIGNLAFVDPLLLDEIKIGVLGGSVLSAVAGYLLLAGAPPAPTAGARDDDPD